MWDFAQKVALVTGGAQGMGLEFTRQLAARGARVAVCDIDEAALADPAGIAGAAVLRRCIDVADPTARRAFVAEVQQHLGPVDLLVNNAGVGVAGPFVEIAGADWDWIRSIDLDAPVDLMRLVLPGMLARRSGRILNVASVSGLMVQPYISSYVATKHALVGLSRAVREEVRPHGVGLTVACPGLVQTQILARVRTRAIDIGGLPPLFRFGLAPEVAVRRMLAALARGDALCIPNRDARLAWMLYRLAPGLFDALLGRFASRLYAKQRAQPPVP